MQILITRGSSARSRVYNISPLRMFFLLALLVGLLYVLAGLVYARGAGDAAMRLGPLGVDITRQVVGEQLDRFRRQELAELRAEIQSIKSSRPPASQAPGTVSEERLQLAVGGIADRQARLEKLLSTDPTRTLELPLLQREVKALETLIQAQASATKDAIDRVNLVVAGVLVVLAASVLTVAFGPALRFQGTRKRLEDEK